MAKKAKGGQIAFLILFLAACNPLERATQRVLLNPEARHKVWEAQAKITPCAVDSFVQFIEGDTLRLTDTIRTQRIDTVDNFYHYNDTIRITRRLTIKDTIRITVHDRADKDSISSKINEIKRVSGHVEELQGKWWKWLLMGLGIGIIIGFLIKLRL